LRKATALWTSPTLIETVRPPRRSVGRTYVSVAYSRTASETDFGIALGIGLSFQLAYACYSMLALTFVKIG
jgi:hypothetical protein